MPPNSSAKVTTPSFRETQKRMRSPSAISIDCAQGAAAPASQTSSEDPPPISNKMTPSAAESASEAEPAAASRASVSRSTISSSSPVSSRTRRKNSAPLLADRQASVAINRLRVTPRARILLRQISSAPRVRSIAAAPSSPVRDRPSPSLTIRENESMTRKPSWPLACWRRPGDQEPAIIGAEIKRGIGVVVAFASPRRARTGAPAAAFAAPRPVNSAP